MKRVLSCLVVLTFFGLTNSVLTHAQINITRMVEKDTHEGPIEIVDLSVEGRAANFEDAITANKDWLKSLALNIKNSHSKSIVYMEIELEIAKTGMMQYPLRLPITFGRIPSGVKASQLIKASEKMAPGRIKKLSISDVTYDFLVNFMTENHVDDIDKVKVFVEFIIFDDDTAWSKGHVMRRDPNDPERWVVNGVWQNGQGVFYKSPKSWPRSRSPSAKCGNSSPNIRTQYSSKTLHDWSLNSATLISNLIRVVNPPSNERYIRSHLINTR